jgi:predicted helicase
METAAEKLAFLGTARMEALAFQEIAPDERHDWLDFSDNDFSSLLPIATKEAKGAKKPSQEKATFKLFSLGVVTARDDWVYDDDLPTLDRKVRWLIDAYNADRARLETSRSSTNLAEMLDTSIKWTRAVKGHLRSGTHLAFNPDLLISANYRPFIKHSLYFSPQLNEVQYRLPRIFGPTGKHVSRTIVFTDPTAQKPFMVLAVDRVFDLHFVGAAAGAVGLPLELPSVEEGHSVENLTDWALDQFKRHYQPGRGKKERPVTKEAIFHYVYGVLHDPTYREKYALNLKREFPRIPFYADFWRWADWGKALMDLHIGYESTVPFSLGRTDIPDEKARKVGLSPKAVLRADKDSGRIVLDSETTLAGVPAEAWAYTLGNRSALEWILDQYKEKTPKDPTIREKFNTYRFADYKDKVIDLLMRVTTVSVETQRIVKAMALTAR